MSSAVTKKYKHQKGLRRSDATKPLACVVDRSDTVLCKQKDPQECAIARAARRADPTILEVDIFRTTAYVHRTDGTLQRYLLNKRTQQEVVAFDQCQRHRARARNMTPGVYTLLPPKGSYKMGAIKKRSKKRPGRHQPAGTKIKRSPVQMCSKKPVTSPGDGVRRAFYKPVSS